MTQLQVLIPGYAQETKSHWQASSTVTLIKDSGKNIIVDPGINRPLLLQKLQEQNLTPNDIHIIFLTHHHPDHAFLAAVFENAITLDGDIIYQNDLETPFEKFIPNTNTQTLATPGHTQEHFSLIAKTDRGTAIVSGDLWWWSNDQKQDISSTQALLDHSDPFAKDHQALVKSRQQVLKIADFIIPSHGQPFYNPQKRR